MENSNWLHMDLDYIRHTAEFQIFDRKSIKIEPKALAVTIIAMANADGIIACLPFSLRQSIWK